MVEDKTFDAEVVRKNNKQGFSPCLTKAMTEVRRNMSTLRCKNKE
jgi:hypothetical protein